MDGSNFKVKVKVKKFLKSRLRLVENFLREMQPTSHIFFSKQQIWPPYFDIFLSFLRFV